MLPYLLIELFYIGVPIKHAYGADGQWTGARSRDYQNVSDGQITTFSYVSGYAGTRYARSRSAARTIHNAFRSAWNDQEGQEMFWTCGTFWNNFVSVVNSS